MENRDGRPRWRIGIFLGTRAGSEYTGDSGGGWVMSSKCTFGLGLGLGYELRNRLPYNNGSSNAYRLASNVVRKPIPHVHLFKQRKRRPNRHTWRDDSRLFGRTCCRPPRGGVLSPVKAVGANRWKRAMSVRKLERDFESMLLFQYIIRIVADDKYSS